MSDAFNMIDLFVKAAIENPLKTAIVFKGQKISFGELDKQVEDTAHYFLERGIKKGDRVLVFVPMSTDLYRTVLALFKIGAISVFLDEWVNKSRMEACCKIAGCRAFVGILKARILAFISPELRRIPIKLGCGIKKAKLKQTVPVTYAQDIALITFTTGSTGTPKAALRTHGFLYHQFKALEKEIGPQADDVSMPVLPIVLLINLAAGITSVIADFKASKPDKFNPQKAVLEIETFGVNTIIASPFFVKKLSEYLIDHKGNLVKIKKIFTGGAPVFPAEAAIYKKAFSEADVRIVYGSTEAEPISTISIDTLLEQKDHAINGLNVGTIADCAEVKIIKIVDNAIDLRTEEQLVEITLDTHKVGEIIVTGNHVLRQYLNNDEALKRNKIFIGEQCWHRTGDSGYLDDDRQLFLTGRCNSVIEKNGNNLYPFVYENYFTTIKGVEIGTIVLYNEIITAVLEIKSTANKSFIKSQIMTAGSLITQVVFVKKIPRDPRHNSKIDYQKLSLLTYHS
jgi:acyl-CoA synthetase (AMP-forming)/AMP-acid ligase II